MIWTCLRKSTAVAFAVCSLGLASHAGAVPETLDLLSARYLGNINDGIPSSLANEVDWINTLLDQGLGTGPIQDGSETYTRTLNTCGGGACPDALLTDSFKGDDSSTIDLDLGWMYVLGKYDAKKAGSYVWYVGGLTGEISIPGALGDCGGGNGCGLSHFSLFNPGDTTNPPVIVPEPASLALVGLALGAAGFAGSRRRRVV